CLVKPSSAHPPYACARLPESYPLLGWRCRGRFRYGFAASRPPCRAARAATTCLCRLSRAGLCGGLSFCRDCLSLLLCSSANPPCAVPRIGLLVAFYGAGFAFLFDCGDDCLLD